MNVISRPTIRRRAAATVGVALAVGAFVIVASGNEATEIEASSVPVSAPSTTLLITPDAALETAAEARPRQEEQRDASTEPAGSPATTTEITIADPSEDDQSTVETTVAKIEVTPPQSTVVPTPTPTNTSDQAEAPDGSGGSDGSGAPEDTVPAPSLAPASTSVQTPDELEGADAPGAGEVHIGPAVLNAPEHPQPPPPGWSEVELSPVEDDAPQVLADDPAPHDVPVVPSVGGPGNFVSNDPGCLSSCIVHALLTPHQLDADVTFDIETNVSARTYLWVLAEQPVIDGGYPVMNTWPNYWNTEETRTWETTLDLDYSTAYWVVVHVVDQLGHDKWAMTEYVAIDQPTPDALHANGDGCYFQCINNGTVYHTDSYDRVDLVIGTSVSAHEDVDFDVAVSASEPGWIGEKPLLPHDEPFIVDQDGGNDIRGHVSGLAPDTVYHVVVKATDEDGFTSHATGQFRTDPLPPPPPPIDVRVTWERMHVVYDGDAGAWGKGEIAVAWGLDQTAYGWRNEEKLGDGSSVALNGHTWTTVEPGGKLPSVVFTVHENDTQGNIEYDVCRELRQLVHQNQMYNSSCTTRVNFALLQAPSLEFLATLPPCKFFDLPAEKDDDRCIVLHTAEANDKHAQIDVLVSFHIAS